MGGWGKSWRPWRPYPSLLAAASRFVITAPSSVTAGRAFSLTITVQNAYGNVVTGYTGTKDEMLNRNSPSCDPS